MKHTLPCSAIRDLLAVSQPEIDLSSAEYTALQNHLKSCPTCQATREEYILLAERLQAASTQIAYTAPAKQPAHAGGASTSLRDTITEDAAEVDAHVEFPSALTLEFLQRFLTQQRGQTHSEISAISGTEGVHGKHNVEIEVHVAALWPDEFTEMSVEDMIPLTKKIMERHLREAGAKNIWIDVTLKPEEQKGIVHPSSLREQLLRYQNILEAFRWKIIPLAKDTLPYELPPTKEAWESPLRETPGEKGDGEAIFKLEEQRDQLIRKDQVQHKDLPTPTPDRPVRLLDLTIKR